MSAGAKALTTVLVVLGILCIVIAVMYLAVDPVDLPDFFPGPNDETLKYKRRAAFFGLVGLILLALSAIPVWRSRNPAAYDDEPREG